MESEVTGVHINKGSNRNNLPDFSWFHSNVMAYLAKNFGSFEQRIARLVKDAKGPKTHQWNAPTWKEMVTITQNLLAQPNYAASWISFLLTANCSWSIPRMASFIACQAFNHSMISIVMRGAQLAAEQAQKVQEEDKN